MFTLMHLILKIYSMAYSSRVHDNGALSFSFILTMNTNRKSYPSKPYLL